LDWSIVSTPIIIIVIIIIIIIITVASVSMAVSSSNSVQRTSSVIDAVSSEMIELKTLQLTQSVATASLLIGQSQWSSALVRRR